MTSNRTESIARLLMAAIFLIAGVRKLLTFTATAAFFGKLGFPMPEVVLVLTILLEIGGGIALVLGWKLPVVSVALGAFTMASALIAHQFWSATPAEYNGQLNNFLKNVAITGGFVLLFEVGRRRPREG